MSTEEIVASAVSKFVDWIAILVAGYFWVVINHIRKDVDNVAEYTRKVENDVTRLEEAMTCIKVTVGKLQQALEDNLMKNKKR